MENRTTLPALAAFVALVSVQVGAAFAKSLFPLVGPEGVAALRIGISAALLAVLFRPWTIRPDRTGLLSLAGYGLVLGLMNILIYRAFAYMPVGIAISIEVIGPLGVAMLASRRRVDFLWIGLALAGLVLLPLGAGQGGLDPRGIAFALAAALCWGLYVKLGARVASVGGGQTVAVGMVVASVVIVPFGLGHAGGDLFLPSVLLYGAIVAVLSSAIPFLLDLFALRHLPSRVFGVFMSASPAVSALAGWIVLDEALSLVQWLGITAIMAACAGSAINAPGRSGDS